MDTDVELISSMDDILQRGAYIGCEQDADEGITLNPGLGIAAEPHNKMIKRIISRLSGTKIYSFGWELKFNNFLYNIQRKLLRSMDYRN